LSRISDTFGGLSLRENVHVDQYLGVIYGIFFILFILLLMLNLVIAMLTTGYEEARNASGATYWAKRQYEFLAEEPEIMAWVRRGDGVDESGSASSVNAFNLATPTQPKHNNTLARYQTTLSAGITRRGKDQQLTIWQEAMIRVRMQFRRSCCKPAPIERDENDNEPTVSWWRRYCCCAVKRDGSDLPLREGGSSSDKWETTRRQPSRLEKMVSSLLAPRRGVDAEAKARLNEDKAVEMTNLGSE